MKLKTRYQEKKEEREMRIYYEYQELLNAPGAMKMAVQEVIMKKYKIHARSTVWSIIKRVEKRFQTVQH